MNLSIRYQILGLMTLILSSSMALYLWIATDQVSRDKLAYVYDATSALANTKSGEVHASLRSFVDKLMFLAAQPVDGSAPHFNQLVDSLLRTDPDILDIEIWERVDGEPTRAYSATNEERLDALGIIPQDLSKLRRERRLSFDAILAERVMLKNNSIPPDIAMLTITAASADNRRVVVVDTHPERLLRLFMSSELFSSYLIDRQGRVLLHSDTMAVIAQRSGQGHPVVEASFDTKVRRGVREYESAAGTMLGAFAHVGLGHVTVVAEIPKGVALQAARQLNRQSWLFAGAVMLLALVASILLGHRIVAPIKRLQTATGEIAKGGFGLHVPVSSRNEIGALADDFNQMSSYLADRENRYMTMVGTLAGGVAHEINNPLFYVLANVEHLRDTVGANESDGNIQLDGKTTADVLEMIEDVTTGARRIHEIVGDLSSFAGTDLSDADSVDVEEVMERAISMAEAQIKYRGRIERNYGSVPRAAATHAHLGQIFLNLLINAGNALQNSSGPDKIIRISTERDGAGEVVVRVSDTGDGIPADLLPRVFEPYFKTPRDGSGFGSGFGLAIAQTLTRRLGGHLRVQSEVGRGATFSVFLPEAPEPEAPSAMVEVERPPRGPIRALIIDDDPLVASTLRRCFKKGDEVEAVGGGAEAIQRLGDDPQLDVVFCDLMMPEVSGIDVYEAIVEIDAALARRFVFMTGGAFTTETNAFLDSVSKTHTLLKKPFEPEMVAGAIERCLRGSTEG